jgi:Protein of unknown function (DUF2281)
VGKSVGQYEIILSFYIFTGMSSIQLYSRIDSLPAELRKEAEDFIDSLIEKSKKKKNLTSVRWDWLKEE